MKALKIKCDDDKACVVFLFIYLRKLVTRDWQVFAKLGWGIIITTVHDLVLLGTNVQHSRTMRRRCCQGYVSNNG